MDPPEFRRRTQRFGVECIRLTERLPSGRVADVIARQLIRSSTSVGANYRAASRAKSPAHMLAIFGTVEEEADESVYWLELISDAGLLPERETAALRQEASEIVAMVVASKKTLRSRISARGAIANRKSSIDND